MFFNPSRDEARQFLFETWRKRREKSLLTPLEDLAAQLMKNIPNIIRYSKTLSGLAIMIIRRNRVSPTPSCI